VPDLAGEPLAGSGVYTAPDGRVYAIEVTDVLLACDLDHDHEPGCYQRLPGEEEDTSRPP
jgi:hypothetical protein